MEGLEYYKIEWDWNNFYNRLLLLQNILTHKYNVMHVHLKIWLPCWNQSLQIPLASMYLLDLNSFRQMLYP